MPSVNQSSFSPLGPMAVSHGKIRVLRIITRLNIGGPAIHVVLLAAGLDPSRYDSILVAGTESPWEGNMLHLAAMKGVRPLLVPELGREISPLDDLVACLKLWRLVRQLRPHIVHTHMAKAGTVGRLAAVLGGVPAIFHTFHGHVFHSYFGPVKTQFILSVERFLARYTDRIVTVGERQREEIARFRIAPSEKLVAIPLGLELEEFLGADQRRGELRRELGLAADTPLVGIVARLVPIKAHEYFLQAVPAISDAVPSARFLIVGDGERRTELEAMAADLGIADRTLFLGWRSDLVRVYADLDVVVLCSLNEGSPVALIEALAAGRPVVATDVGGVGDVVRHEETGLLVLPKDSAGLAAAVIRLLKDRQLAMALGSSGRRSVYPQHSSARLVKDVSSLYEEVLAAKRVV